MISDAGTNVPHTGCKVSLKQFAAIHKGLAKYENYVIYDEYVNNQCTYVLNGNLFGLIGLHDYYEATGNLNALSAFNEGCKSIEVQVPYYDYYGSTTYDLLHLLLPESTPALDATYAHDYCIVFLDALFKFTGNTVFSKYRDIFISYYEPQFYESWPEQ